MFKRPWVVGTICLLAIAVGLGVWWWRRGADEQVDQAALQELMTLRDAGIARLENGEIDAAAEDFRKITELRPKDPLGHRNLAVARMFQLRDAVLAKHTEEGPALIAKATPLASEAIDRLIEFAPKSYVAWLFKFRLYRELAEQNFSDVELRETALQAIGEALQIKNDAAHLWYEKYTALQNANEPERKDEAYAALVQSYELAPRNLVLITEILKEGVTRQDPDLPKRMEAVRETIVPIAELVKRHSKRYDPLAMFDEAATALAKETPDWSGARRQLFLLSNLVNPELATKLDRRRLTPHELEFLLFDYAEDFREPDTEWPPGIPVKFARAKSFPDTSDVAAFKLTDFDLDAKTDLITTQDKSVNVFIQREGGWESVVSLELPFQPTGVQAADLDDDAVPEEKEDSACATADPDVVVWGDGGLVVLRNVLDADGNRRTLEDIPNPELAKLRDVLAVGIGDLDHDSDLDLAVSTKQGMSLWMNEGDGTFYDTSRYSTLPSADFQPREIHVIDFDRDVLLDVVLTDPESGTSAYLQNLRHGQFRYRTFDVPTLVAGRVLRSMEADGNAAWDWLATDGEHVMLSLFRHADGRYVLKKESEVVVGSVDEFELIDYDNDGYQDVLVMSEGEWALHRGGPDGQFRKADDVLPDKEGKFTECEVADVDGDGDLDFVALINGRATLFTNEGGNANGWISLALRAQTEDVKFRERRCNVQGWGSLVEVKAGSHYQARVVDGPVTHLGLGTSQQPDAVRVLWTNGIPQNEITPPRNATVCSKQELLKGSCPYLYIWDGEKYAFFTDLLWASPIGLQFADGVLAPAREWEYLKIPGERLKPIDGEYRMQITEELWEAAYFDSVKLIAVDHPAEIDIFTNEKVGPAAIAEHKIHTVHNRRLPVKATNQRAEDVLPLIAKEDERFLQSYTERFTQGLTPEHYLELDLGNLEDPQRITLFLTGWVFPTDTSLNVWLSHQKKLPPPKPPSIWVPNESGEWVETIPYSGFPGGKTKTIAIDLTGKFPTSDYRVRIKTSMELRWDAAFFTLDEQPVEVVTTEIPVDTAKLFYRGFSRRIEGQHNGPETYIFSDVETTPYWPPMDGAFTQFGDVTELIRDDDDRLVVMGAGDTMTLRFRVPDKPIPPGWKRDFVVRNVGWDKDADLHTVLGQTVEPLPFREMSQYPPPPSEAPDKEKLYKSYLKTYQTRYQRGSDFWNVLKR